MTKDFEVTLKLRNNQLKSRRMQLGLSSWELTQRARVVYGTYLKLEGMKLSPLRKFSNGRCDWTTTAKKIANFHGCTPEELFPKSVLMVQRTETSGVFDLEQLPPYIIADIPPELPSPEDAMISSEVKGAVSDAINNLPPREKQILTLRFGLNGSDEHTLEEVSSVVGVTRERIRQIERRALKAMRPPLARHANPSDETTELLLSDIEKHREVSYHLRSMADKYSKKADWHKEFYGIHQHADGRKTTEYLMMASKAISDAEENDKVIAELEKQLTCL